MAERGHGFSDWEDRRADLAARLEYDLTVDTDRVAIEWTVPRGDA